MKRLIWIQLLGLLFVQPALSEVDETRNDFDVSDKIEICRFMNNDDCVPGSITDCSAKCPKDSTGDSCRADCLKRCDAMTL